MENITYERPDELSHHGTKGMRWGIRRYQNKDGSLTNAGRKRYGEDSDGSKSKMSFREKRAANKKAKEAEARKQARLEAMRKGREAKQKQAEEEAKRKIDIEAKKKEVLASRSAKNLYENANLFTNEELNAAYQRLTLERNISQLTPKEVNKGARFVDNAIAVGRKVNDIADVGMKLYNNAARLHNSLSDSGDKWPLIKDNDQKKKKGGGEGEKKKDKGNNNNQNNNNKNNKQKEKPNKNQNNPNNNSEKPPTGDGGKKTEGKKAESKSKGKSEAKSESWTGTVEGKGTSTSSIKNGSDWFNSKDWEDIPYSYYKETTALVPTSSVERWLDDYWAN